MLKSCKIYTICNNIDNFFKGLIFTSNFDRSSFRYRIVLEDPESGFVEAMWVCRSKDAPPDFIDSLSHMKSCDPYSMPDIAYQHQDTRGASDGGDLPPVADTPSPLPADKPKQHIKTQDTQDTLEPYPGPCVEDDRFCWLKYNQGIIPYPELCDADYARMIYAAASQSLTQESLNVSRATFDRFLATLCSIGVIDSKSKWLDSPVYFGKLRGKAAKDARDGARYTRLFIGPLTQLFYAAKSSKGKLAALGRILRLSVFTSPYTPFLCAYPPQYPGAHAVPMSMEEASSKLGLSRANASLYLKAMCDLTFQIDGVQHHALSKNFDTKQAKLMVNQYFISCGKENWYE